MRCAGADRRLLLESQPCAARIAEYALLAH
jgi:hypothetical protein